MRGRAANLADSVYRRLCRMETLSESGAPILRKIYHAGLTAGFVEKWHLRQRMQLCRHRVMDARGRFAINTQAGRVALGYALRELLRFFRV